MLFNSLHFLVFFPVVCLVFFLVPRRMKNVFLLLASYYFYMCWNPKYALLMLASTVITWLSGILIIRGKKDDIFFLKAKTVVALSFISNLAILFFFKYFNFFAHNVVHLFGLFGITWKEPVFDIILPIGISFYTFQALSYTMDVYRGEVQAEYNFINYALFVSFFPQLVAGPIERSKNLLYQINSEHRFNFENMRRGLLQMAYGYFQKLVIAETAAIAVTEVYGNFVGKSYSGAVIAFGTVLFAFQIYCDFAGYSNIARGAATVMGFSLMENFHNPYFAKSVSEFWKRWHISLSSWFRDYLYIPLGGNRRGKKRKYLNVMIVFLVSGLWHGADWTYLIWGGLNGLFQVIEEILKPVRHAIEEKSHVRKTAGYRFFQILGTFILIDFTWLFFRAEDLGMALWMLKIQITDFRFWKLFDGTLLTLGLSYPELVLLGISLLILLAVDILKERGIDVIDGILAQGIVTRWLIYMLLLFWILIFGIYGPIYDAGQFIYFQF